MKHFSFRGKIPASKSMMNRALIAKSFFPDLMIEGFSSCEDVAHMQAAIASFPQKSEIVCGEAGTVLRFMALRASREKGVWHLQGSRRLLQRPQRDLQFLLKQLSVEAKFFDDHLEIHSQGWKETLGPLDIPMDKSSQFASALLINSWELEWPLEFVVSGSLVSESYWRMSLALMKQMGMVIGEKNQNHFFIPAGQSPQLRSIHVEPDASAAFSIVAAALLAGEAQLEGMPSSGLQPDFVFFDILERMNAPFRWQNSVLLVRQAQKLRPIDFVLRDCPDLFPVLSVLCAHAEGESRLHGAPQLIYKESQRIKKTAELLQFMGIEVRLLPDGLCIQGQGLAIRKRTFSFDPDQDHRMAMAAGILLRAGWDVQLKNPEVVNKSFPEFWNFLELNP